MLITVAIILIVIIILILILVTWSESEEGSSRLLQAGCPDPGETTGLGPPERHHGHQDEDQDHHHDDYQDEDQDERNQGTKKVQMSDCESRPRMRCMVTTILVQRQVVFG